MRDKIWFSCVCYYSDTYLVVMIFLLPVQSPLLPVPSYLIIVYCKYLLKTFEVSLAPRGILFTGVI